MVASDSAVPRRYELSDQKWSVIYPVAWRSSTSNMSPWDYQEFRVRAGRSSSQAAIAFEKRSANMTAI